MAIYLALSVPLARLNALLGNFVSSYSICIIYIGHLNILTFIKFLGVLHVHLLKECRL